MNTYAATLASEVMRFLLAMAAYFDLEMRQYDAVTAFLITKLDEIICTNPPPGFGKKSQLWLLLMALYGHVHIAGIFERKARGSLLLSCRE